MQAYLKNVLRLLPGKTRHLIRSIFWLVEKTLDLVGNWVYPYGFKLHYLTDVLAAERQDDGSMFLKIYCDVKNAYGTWAKNLVCEAYVGGTEGDPKILGFNVY